MSALEVVFSVPENVVQLPFDDDAAVAVAARASLERFPTPVSDKDIAFHEGVFLRVAQNMRNTAVDECFIVLPEPPGLGFMAYLSVRYHPNSDEASVADLVAESAGGTRIVLGEPDVTTQETPLGVGTRNLLRFSTEAPVKKRFGRKTEAPVYEQLSWYWAVKTADGEPFVVNVSAFTFDLGVTPLTRPIIDAFARAIEFA